MFFNLLVGVVTILGFIFVLFPTFLKEVTQMDSYKLGVFSILLVCSVYWVYWLVVKFKKREGTKEPTVLRPVQIIRNPVGYQYLIDGKMGYHIPDPDTFNYLGSLFGFTWADSRVLEVDEINRRFTVGKQLPSIRLYFPKTQEIIISKVSELGPLTEQS